MEPSILGKSYMDEVIRPTYPPFEATVPEIPVPNTHESAKELPITIESVIAPYGRTDQQDETSYQLLVPPQSEVAERPNFWRRHWQKIAAGSILGGLATDLAIIHANGSFDTLEHKILEVAPWAVTGVAASEGLWIGGAVLACIGIGRKIGNPLTLHERWREILGGGSENATFRAGLAINALGALGTAGVLLTAAVIALPRETWPGAAVLIAGDVIQTVATRMPFLLRHTSERQQIAERVVVKSVSVQEASAPVLELPAGDTGEQVAQQTVVLDSPQVAKGEARTSERKILPPHTSVRKASMRDITTLVELDRRLFRGAYNDKLPSEEAVATMLMQRLGNNPDGMFVAEVGSEIRGFVTAFRTDVPVESFVSWEHSTADGTLEDKVKETGKYLYIANLTVDTKGAPEALDMLLANVFAKGISDGVEYGYFCSRIPGFRRWLEARVKEDRGITVEKGQDVASMLDEEALDTYAEDYIHTMKRVDNKGKKYRPRDPELALYASLGLQQIKLAPGGFEDWASVGFEVVHKAPVPAFAAWARPFKPVRQAIGTGIRMLAKHPKILNKVL